ncbi:MAG: transcriptional repressor [Balneolaceae bacterium]|nr:MAG: transcriptional repressor [Balneolaceae bacterium]
MNTREILKAHDVRITSHRLDVLKHLIRFNHAFSHSTLEKQFKDKMDRVTIYRILDCFLEANLICKIVDSNGKVSYVFDNHSRKAEKHDHPHFKCYSCESVVGLPNLPDSYLAKLSGFKIDHLMVLAEGKCENCLTDN